MQNEFLIIAVRTESREITLKKEIPRIGIAKKVDAKSFTKSPTWQFHDSSFTNLPDSQSRELMERKKMKEKLTWKRKWGLLVNISLWNHQMYTNKKG